MAEIAAPASLQEQLQQAISAGDTEAASRIAIALAAQNKKPSSATRCKVVGCSNDASETAQFCKDHVLLFKAAPLTSPKSAAPALAASASSKHDASKQRLRAAGKGTLAGSRLEGATTSEEMEVELRHCWHAAYQVVFKDLPRLARRITVQTDKAGTVVKVGRIVGEAKAEGKEQGEEDIWVAIANVVWTVAQHLEDASSHAEIKATIDAFVEKKGADQQLAVQNLFVALGKGSPGEGAPEGEAGGRTFAVFRAIHQSMLFPPLASLHSRLFAQLGPMKDVRRPDGWVVHIYLGEAVTVTHTRWEQSLNEPSDPDHYEVQWSISMSFDKKMAELRASFLRIKELQLHSEMTREKKELITGVLRGNGYLIS